MTLFIDILISAWSVLADSALFLAGGFLLAGFIRSFLDIEKATKHLGGPGLGPIIKASLIGVPLPLCSCSVLPAGLSLKQKGASRGATSAFLISTPETGVDSIALSWAILDPIMTVFRPVAAFVTATTAGILELVFGKENDTDTPAGEAPDASGCGCDNECSGPAADTRVKTRRGKLAEGYRYATGELMDDLAWWLFLGLLMAGAVLALIPEGFFEASFFANPLIAMPVMLVIGVPMYICATSSTPLAAALIIKGLSPGAALVFLLAGPATNIASVMAIRQFMGNRSLAIYLGAIAVSAILLGLLLDFIYHASGITPSAVMGEAAEVFPAWLEQSAALVMFFFILRSVYRTKLSPLLHSGAEGEREEPQHG